MKQAKTLLNSHPALNGGRVVGPSTLEQPSGSRRNEYAEDWKLPSALGPRWGQSGSPTVTASSLAEFNRKLLAQTEGRHCRKGGPLARAFTQREEMYRSSAVMEERRRMAREIHDTLAQEFAGILLHLEAVRVSDFANGGIRFGCITRAKELARSGLEDARRMLLDLRPKSLEGSTLFDALNQLAQCFIQDSGIACDFQATGRERDLPPEFQDELYRMAQEALCNVRKHSRATSALLSLHYGRRFVLLKIKDNGQGFVAVKQQAPGHGFGLPTMRERACRLGGRIDINSAPGTGTKVIVSMPLGHKTRTEETN
jgi:signal transduction histidine kinase